MRQNSMLAVLVRDASKEKLFELWPGAQIKAMVKHMDRGV